MPTTPIQPENRQADLGRPAADGWRVKQERWLNFVSAPVDGASLGFFRICFGLLTVWDAIHYAWRGWITDWWVAPKYSFGFIPFIHPWPGSGMYWHFFALGLLGTMIAAGWLYRWATALFCAGFTYVFLLEKAQYLNHFYLICLIAFLMVLIPANRCFSLDAFRRGWPRPGWVPRWSLLILQGQLALVYWFAGLAKVNPDWIAGEPLRTWLAFRSHTSAVGGLLTQEWLIAILSYGGLAADLIFPILLFFRRTFWIAVAIAVPFHLANAYLFNIGIFPWFMLASLGLFARPDWPRRWGRRLRFVGEGATSAHPRPEAGGSVPTGEWDGRPPRWMARLLAVYFLIQVTLPLRHWLYPGNVNWTEEGHRFSWRMKLRHKEGIVQFVLVEPGMVWGNPVRLQDELTPLQIERMAVRPDMIRQYARHLAAEYQSKHGVRPKVYAAARASLNGRPPQLLVDPNVDLAAQGSSWGHASWILPLEQKSAGKNSEPRNTAPSNAGPNGPSAE